MAHLTEKQYQHLRKYIRAMADKMELRDWTIILSRDPCGVGADASMFCTYGSKTVTIAVGSEFTELTQERQRVVIVHELIHAHFYPWQWSFNNLQFSVNQELFKAIRAGIIDAEEYATQALTDIIARNMPLPSAKTMVSTEKMDKEEATRGVMGQKPPNLSECDQSKGT